MLIKRFSINFLKYILLVGIISISQHPAKAYAFDDSESSTFTFVNDICPIVANSESVTNKYGSYSNCESNMYGDNRIHSFIYSDIGQFSFLERTSDGFQFIIYWELEGTYVQNKYGLMTVSDIQKRFGKPGYITDSFIRYAAWTYYVTFYIENGVINKVTWDLTDF